MGRKDTVSTDTLRVLGVGRVKPTCFEAARTNEHERQWTYTAQFFEPSLLQATLLDPQQILSFRTFTYVY